MSRTTELSCKDVELVYGGSGCKCAHYRKLFPNGECECCSVSDHSPGAVQDDEILFRFLLPEHFRDGSGEIARGALRAVNALGLSMIRGRHVPFGKLEDRALMYARQKNVPWSDVSLAIVRCGDLRAITSSGAKGYCVYDTATEHDPAHADVCRGLVFPPGTPDQRSCIKSLVEDLSDIFTVRRGFLV